MSNTHFLSEKEIKNKKYKQVCTTMDCAKKGLGCEFWKKDSENTSKDCKNCYYAIYITGSLIGEKQKKIPIFCSHISNKDR